MRVLSVSTTVPYPPDHGTRLRTWNLLRRMAGWAEVSILTWDRSGEAPPALRDIARHVAVGEVGDVPMGTGSRAMRWARALAGGMPPWIQALRSERSGFGQAAEAVAALHREEPFDLVVAEDDAAAFLLPELDAPLVVHRHNVFSHTLRQLRRGSKRLSWPAERTVWRRFDRATGLAQLQVATTIECADALGDIGTGPVAVVPNGVDVPEVSVECGGGRDVAFIGTLDYAPNAEAVEWFAAAVWPRVRSRHPDSTFIVIGRGAGERLRRLEGDGVRLAGYAPDLTVACSTVRAGVVPLQAGLGIKNKTLDLMAMGLPVVATPVGAEGIGRGPIVVADAASYADAVSALLADPARAARLGAEGRATVAEDFSWDAAAATYRSVLEEVARTRERVTP